MVPEASLLDAGDGGLTTLVCYFAVSFASSLCVKWMSLLCLTIAEY